MSEIIVIAKSKAKKGFEDQLETAVKAAIPPTHAEPGCIKYALHRSIEDPSQFVLIEKWTSKEALNEHLKTPHIQILFKKLAEIVAESPVIQIFEGMAVGNREKGEI